MAKKQTVQLSQLLDHAVNEVHASPYIKGYKTISRIVSTIPAAQGALRIQLIAKMRAYCNKFLEKKEMYYCFCLTDYLVVHNPEFRPQVLNSDFVQLFEKVSDFDKAKKRMNIVKEKGLKNLQSWAVNYPNEMPTYKILYNALLSKGVVFPIADERITDDSNDIIKKIKGIIPEVEECEKLILSSLKGEVGSFKLHAAEALHTRAVRLNSELNELIVKYEVGNNSTHLDEYKQIEKGFSAVILELENYINKPDDKEELYRTYTTGHIGDNDGMKTMNNDQLQMTLLNNQSYKKPVSNDKPNHNNVNINRYQSSVEVKRKFALAPPPSKGQPIRNKSKPSSITQSYESNDNFMSMMMSNGSNGSHQSNQQLRQQNSQTSVTINTTIIANNMDDTTYKMDEQQDNGSIL